MYMYNVLVQRNKCTVKSWLVTTVAVGGWCDVCANVVESSPSVESGISVGSSRFETIPSSPPDAADSDGATAAAGESVKHPAASTLEID